MSPELYVISLKIWIACCVFISLIVLLFVVFGTIPAIFGCDWKWNVLGGGSYSCNDENARNNPPWFYSLMSVWLVLASVSAVQYPRTLLRNHYSS